MELNVLHARPVSFWIQTGTVKVSFTTPFLSPQSYLWFQFVSWVVNSVPMAPGIALLAHRALLRTGTTAQSAILFR
jgi:hypothetical protein